LKESRQEVAQQKKRQQTGRKVDTLLSCIAILDDVNRQVNTPGLAAFYRKNPQHRVEAVDLVSKKIKKKYNKVQNHLDGVLLKSETLEQQRTSQSTNPMCSRLTEENLKPASIVRLDTQDSNPSIDTTRSGATAQELLKMTTNKLSPTIADATIKIVKEEVDKQMPFLQEIEGQMRKGSSSRVKGSDCMAQSMTEDLTQYQFQQALNKQKGTNTQIDNIFRSAEPPFEISYMQSNLSGDDRKGHCRKKSLEESSSNDVINYFFELGKGV